ncbi:MAG: FeoB small GTPase domain-containing protein [Nocardioides sp.]
MGGRPLSEAPYGATVTVVDSHTTPAMRRRLAEIGIRPGAEVQVLHHSHGGGRVLGVAETRIAVGLDALSSIWVSGEPASDDGTAAVAMLDRPLESTPGTALPPTAGARCHPSAPPAGPTTGAPRVALVGAPNSGKSTLFTMLSGAAAGVGNWPGTTVEVGQGRWHSPALPRAVSLPISCAQSPSRCHRTRRSPVTSCSGRRPTDPTSPSSSSTPPTCPEPGSLAQVRELEPRVVVALTMSDIAARRGLRSTPTRFPPTPWAALRYPSTLVAGRGDRRSPRRSPRPSPAPRPRPRDPDTDDDLALADDRFRWVEAAVTASTVRGALPRRRSWSDRLDRVLLAPWTGMLVFLAVMWAVFQVTTTVAVCSRTPWAGSSPGREEHGDRGSAGGDRPDGTRAGPAGDGMVAGVGMLLTFVPLMALMFCCWLCWRTPPAWPARLSSPTGSCSGSACPAVDPAARGGFRVQRPRDRGHPILPHPRQRLLTVLLVPFTSCSARLTVYVLLATTFFPGNAGTVVFATCAGRSCRQVGRSRTTLWRTLGREPLVLVLPPYQRPTVRVVGAVTWRRLRGFLETAGGIIVATVTVVWLLQAVPVGAAPSARSPSRTRCTAPCPAPFALLFTGGAGFGQSVPRVRAGGGIRREGGGHLVVGADLRGGRPGRGWLSRVRSATPSTRRSRSPRRPPDGGGGGLHGLPAGLHAAWPPWPPRSARWGCAGPWSGSGRSWPWRGCWQCWCSRWGAGSGERAGQCGPGGVRRRRGVRRRGGPTRGHQPRAGPGGRRRADPDGPTRCPRAGRRLPERRLRELRVWHRWVARLRGQRAVVPAPGPGARRPDRASARRPPRDPARDLTESALQLDPGRAPAHAASRPRWPRRRRGEPYVPANGSERRSCARNIASVPCR